MWTSEAAGPEKAAVRSLLPSVRWVLSHGQIARLPMLGTRQDLNLVRVPSTSPLVNRVGLGASCSSPSRVPVGRTLVTVVGCLLNIRQLYLGFPHLISPLSPSLRLRGVTLSVTLSPVITLPHSGRRSQIFPDWEELDQRDERPSLVRSLAQASRCVLTPETFLHRIPARCLHVFWVFFFSFTKIHFFFF